MPVCGGCCSSPVPPAPTPSTFSVPSIVLPLGCGSPTSGKALQASRAQLRVARPQGAAGEAQYPPSCLGGCQRPPPTPSVQALSVPSWHELFWNSPEKPWVWKPSPLCPREAMPSTVSPHGWGPGWRQAPSPWLGLEYRERLCLLPSALVTATLLSSLLSFSPFVLGFAFSLLLLLCPAKAAKGVRHSPEPSPLPLGEAGSEPTRSSLETRGPARNSGEQSPSPPEPAGPPPNPWSKPDTFLLVFPQGNPSSRGGGCQPASCSPWRRRSIVAGGQRAPLGGSQ